MFLKYLFVPIFWVVKVCVVEFSELIIVFADEPIVPLVVFMSLGIAPPMLAFSSLIAPGTVFEVVFSVLSVIFCFRTRLASVSVFEFIHLSMSFIIVLLCAQCVFRYVPFSR